MSGSAPTFVSPSFARAAEMMAAGHPPARVARWLGLKESELVVRASAGEAATDRRDGSPPAPPRPSGEEGRAPRFAAARREEGDADPPEADDAGPLAIAQEEPVARRRRTVRLARTARADRVAAMLAAAGPAGLTSAALAARLGLRVEAMRAFLVSEPSRFARIASVCPAVWVLAGAAAAAAAARAKTARERRAIAETARATPFRERRRGELRAALAQAGDAGATTGMLAAVLGMRVENCHTMLRRLEADALVAADGGRPCRWRLDKTGNWEPGTGNREPAP